MQRIKTLSEYFKKYELSEKDPESFWSEIADSFAKKKIVIFASVFIERNERRMVSKIEGREILWYALARVGRGL